MIEKDFPDSRMYDGERFPENRLYNIRKSFRGTGCITRKEFPGNRIYKGGKIQMKRRNKKQQIIAAIIVGILVVAMLFSLIPAFML